MQIKKDKKSAKKYVPIVLIAVILLAGGWITYTYLSKTWPFTSSDSKTSSTSDGTSINYDPPTDQEVDESQDAKKRDNQEEQSKDTDKTPTDQKKSIDVGISYADISGKNLEIRAFTNNVIEGTGTCTATVVMKGMENMEGMRVTKSSEAFIDATSTLCRPIYIPTSQLHSGTWEVSVKFSSPDREGTSDTVEVKVP